MARDDAGPGAPVPRRPDLSANFQRQLSEGPKFRINTGLGSDGRGGVFQCFVQDWAPPPSQSRAGTRPSSAQHHNGADSCSDEDLDRHESRRHSKPTQREQQHLECNDQQQQPLAPLRSSRPASARRRHPASPGSSFDSTNDGLCALLDAANRMDACGDPHSPAKTSCLSTGSMHNDICEPEDQSTPSSRQKRRLPSPLHRHAKSMPAMGPWPSFSPEEEHPGTPSPPESRTCSPHQQPPLKRRQSTPCSAFERPPLAPQPSSRHSSLGHRPGKQSRTDEDVSWSNCTDGISHGSDTEPDDEEVRPQSRSRSRREVAAGKQDRLGHWTQDEKQRLLDLVQDRNPCGAADWEAIASMLKRYSKGGASAERMYRTLTDPDYKKSTNKHGRRLNSRKGTPMHIMAAFALKVLPGHQGNLTMIAEHIEAYPFYSDQLDFTARPGTKTYPRWKDALLGCFKPGRYNHLVNTKEKEGGLNVYRLLVNRMPADVATSVSKAEAHYYKCLQQKANEAAHPVAKSSVADTQPEDAPGDVAVQSESSDRPAAPLLPAKAPKSMAGRSSLSMGMRCDEVQPHTHTAIGHMGDRPGADARQRQ